MLAALGVRRRKRAGVEAPSTERPTRPPSCPEDLAERDPDPDCVIVLSDLTAEGWRQALEEAFDCLDSRRKHRGRAVQTLTLANGNQVQGEVSPHLMFRNFATGAVEWEHLFREGKERMQPLYDWARRRAARAVTF